VVRRVVGGPEREDPGWSTVAKGAAWTLVPVIGFRRARRGAAGDGLLQLRSVFISFATALVLIGVVVAVLASGRNQRDVISATIGVTVVILVGTLAALVVHALEKPLDAASPKTLSASYIRRFFLRLAAAEAPALVGFVMFLLTGRPWLYLVGALLAAVGFVRAIPSASNLQHDQDKLQPSPISLTRALRDGRHESST
jgi:peptidoglycan/LPS O-acetylase OafA/YrhL